jgi:ferritin
LAFRKKDYPAQVLLQWFITEQVEEEKKAFKGVCPLCGNELKNDMCIKE